MRWRRAFFWLWLSLSLAWIAFVCVWLWSALRYGDRGFVALVALVPPAMLFMFYRLGARGPRRGR